MAEEEKGDQQPKLQSVKACIVSMEYTNKNTDGTPTLAPLVEMYSDADKVKQLFENILGWHKEDISTF
jgi:hypothetical protein